MAIHKDKYETIEVYVYQIACDRLQEHWSTVFFFVLFCFLNQKNVILLYKNTQNIFTL